MICLSTNRQFIGVYRRASAVALFLAFPALAVDGTVMNRTTNRPAANVPVTLVSLSEGMKPLQTVKTDAGGKFNIPQSPQGPVLLQASFDGVTYSQMLQPGSPTTGVQLEVFSSSKKPGDAQVTQHMFLFEPTGRQMIVSETYLFQNTGKTTYDDPDNGTLRFQLPAQAKGIVQVRATAPQGMPVQRTAEKTTQPNVYKVDFPIKPGETRFDLTYLVPFADGQSFVGRILHKGGATRLVAPNGVTLSGANITSLGTEPSTQAQIYEVKGQEFQVSVQGAGSLRASERPSESGAPEISTIMPRIYRNVSWIVALGLGILTLGFVLLYRAQPAQERNERRRR